MFYESNVNSKRWRFKKGCFFLLIPIFFFWAFSLKAAEEKEEFDGKPHLAPLLDAHFEEPFPESNGLFRYLDEEIFLEEEKHKRRAIISKTTAALMGLIGSAILIYLSFNFGEEDFGFNETESIIMSIISAISPVFGFYSVNNPKYKNIFSCGHYDSEQMRFSTWKSAAKETALFVSNVATASTMAYVTEKTFSPYLGRWSVPFDIATYISFHFVYDYTGRKFWEMVGNNIDSICCSSRTTAYDDKSRLIGFLKRLRKRYANLSAEEIYASKNTSYNMAISSEERLKMLLDDHLPASDDTLSARPNKRFSFYNFIGVTGGLIGLAGTYYFFKIGNEEIKELLLKWGASESTVDFISPITGALIYACRGSFSVFTTRTTFINISKYFKNFARKKSCLARSREGGIFFLLSALAFTRATPNVKMSLDFLGKNAAGITLSSLAGVTTFSSSFWALNMFKTRQGQSKEVKLKTKITGDIDKLIKLSEFLKPQAIRKLNTLIEPQRNGVNYV